jgi:hypothetical protein
MSSRLPPAVVLLAALAVALSSSAASVAAVAPGGSEVTLVECRTGKAAGERSAIFRGEMSQMPQASQMRMRLELAERIGTSVWRGIAGLAPRGWRYSKPGIQRFVFDQTVLSLKPATRYRMSGSFQWLDDEGEVVARQSSTSSICRQRGKLPNPAIRDDVHARSGPTEGTYRYAIHVGNNGVAASPPFEVRLSVDGGEVDVRRVGRLRPRERRTLRFVGPACVGGVKAEIDPNDVVREITERDNVRRTPCSRAFLPR